MKSSRQRYVAATVLAAGVLGLAASSALAQGNPLRDAYFGETHIHTSYSLDAWTMGNRVTDPGDSYKYFKGEPIKSPLGYDIKIDTPLDFAGVTDHSEYVGIVNLANDPNSPISKMAAAQPLVLKNDSPEEVQRVFLTVVHLLGNPTPDKALMSPKIAHEVWEKTVEFAEAANEPGKFTAFCSYEWTSMPNNMNLHRNIFFKDCKHIPFAPFSSLSSHGSNGPLEVDGRPAQGGQRALGDLPQRQPFRRADVSDRNRYQWEADRSGLCRGQNAQRASDRDQADQGAVGDPSALSPNDEFADYEIWSTMLGDPTGRLTHIVGSYARQALKDGLALEDVKGFNPYKFGFGAASDSHATGDPLPAGQLLRHHRHSGREHRGAHVWRRLRRHRPALDRTPPA